MQTTALGRAEAPDAVTERRAVLRVLQHWRAAAGDRPFPARDDIDPEAIVGDWQNCFIVDLCGHRGPCFRYVGAMVRIAAWGDGIGCRVTDCPPGTILAVATSYIKNVLASRQPVTHSGSALHAGYPVLFRSILLPLSDGGSEITSLLGTANYRRVEENRLEIIDDD
jgi:hypothetical protein